MGGYTSTNNCVCVQECERDLLQIENCFLSWNRIAAEPTRWNILMHNLPSFRTKFVSKCSVAEEELNIESCQQPYFRRHCTEIVHCSTETWNPYCLASSLGIGVKCSPTASSTSNLIARRPGGGAMICNCSGDTCSKWPATADTSHGLAMVTL